MTQPLHPAAVPVKALDYSDSILPRMIPNESELTAGVRIEPGRNYGFFTDTSLCIGCKACEVACKEWNALPVDELGLTGMSYDNTKRLSSGTWRHVAFVEKLGEKDGERPTILKPYQSNWLMMSDVCKHCRRAGCLEACPTGALFRTEFGTVVVQQDICNGCAYCVPACPFGVIALNEHDGKAHKCTLCYDRLKSGLEPACAKSCPTNSIQFGEVERLQDDARKRVKEVRDAGRAEAYLYGAPGEMGASGGIEALYAFFLLLDRPEVYNLPQYPTLPFSRLKKSTIAGAAAIATLGVIGALFLGTRK